MLPDVVGAGRIRPVEDVRVAVGRARSVRELRRRLVVAQRHAEPEGNVELEVPRTAPCRLLRLDFRVVGKVSSYMFEFPEPGVFE